MQINVNLLAQSLIYSAIGIVIFLVAYRIMAWILPFNVSKELSEDNNVAVGVLLGAMMLGLAIIIASALHG